MSDSSLYEIKLAAAMRMRQSVFLACYDQNDEAFDLAVLEWERSGANAAREAVAKECLDIGSLWGMGRLVEQGLPLGPYWAEKAVLRLTRGDKTVGGRQPKWDLLAFSLQNSPTKMSDSDFIQLMSLVGHWLPGDARRSGLSKRFEGRWETPFDADLSDGGGKGLLTPLQLAWLNGWASVCTVMLEGGASFDALAPDSDMPQWNLQNAMEDKRWSGGIHPLPVQVRARIVEEAWGNWKGQPEWMALRALVSGLAREKQLEQALPAAVRIPLVRF